MDKKLYACLSGLNNLPSNIKSLFEIESDLLERQGEYNYRPPFEDVNGVPVSSNDPFRIYAQGKYNFTAHQFTFTVSSAKLWWTPETLIKDCGGQRQGERFDINKQHEGEGLCNIQEDYKASSQPMILSADRQARSYATVPFTALLSRFRRQIHHSNSADAIL